MLQEISIILQTKVSRIKGNCTFNIVDKNRILAILSTGGVLQVQNGGFIPKNKFPLGHFSGDQQIFSLSLPTVKKEIQTFELILFFYQSGGNNILLPHKF